MSYLNYTAEMVLEEFDGLNANDMLLLCK